MYILFYIVNNQVLEDDVEVFDFLVVIFDDLIVVCLNDGVQSSFSGGDFMGGEYLGFGVMDNNDGLSFMFDLQEVGVGLYIFIYIYIDGNGCVNSIIVIIEVLAFFNVNFFVLVDFCVNVGVQFVLSGGSLVGGIYSGFGVVDDGNGQMYIFDLVIVGVGMYIIIYIYIDNSGCINMVIDQVEVFMFFGLFFIVLDDLCIDVG